MIKHIELNQVVLISGIECTCVQNQYGFPEYDNITHILKPKDGSQEIHIIKNRWNGKQIDIKRV